MKSLTLILLSLIFINAVDATIIHAGKQRVVKSVQQAIQMAAKGDTVMVDAGEYHEKNLIINKSICLNWYRSPCTGWRSSVRSHFY